MTVFQAVPFGVLLEGIVCLFLIATIAYCAMLDRRLRAMRSGQDGLRDLIRDLNTATAQAAAAIDNLKTATLPAKISARASGARGGLPTSWR